MYTFAYNVHTLTFIHKYPFSHRTDACTHTPAKFSSNTSTTSTTLYPFSTNTNKRKIDANKNDESDLSAVTFIF